MPQDAPRVLVVDDDPDVALLVKTVLERRAGCEVVVAQDGLSAVERLTRFTPDVVVTDIEMPGLDGLELLAELRRKDPLVPVIVMTAHVSVEYAVSALRAQADEFLTKPLDNARLVEAVSRLAAEGRARREANRSPEVILAIGAHPDDVEIGVGGILAAHARAGDSITVLTLSRGSRGGDAESRQHESLASADMLGARLFLKDLVDTEISGGGATVRLIEEVVQEVRPTIVYTHSSHDRHQDHRAVSEATIAATRRVGTVACYQSPSSTIDFRPTRFVRIDQDLPQKLRLLECFASQTAMRDYLEPDFVTATARYWSRFGGGVAVEPLEVVRETAEFIGAHELARRES
ncbi:LmbE family N-acetylglucosaminyl deacetylase/CheY-like chemotaxis protein [Microbacterium phyllosphaerae]|uniref:LmbE family N-acetylglucosaminyl deacetylase/CheY-like chemotaxis protein n=1 Tax=Microbacterium phyllosphaerae TaxID=124798 RepID=A0ABS4WNY4_9MICO|nr:response regulator [Microbacterium phyllosphaerae]MBP2377916.1 LmbE family N-acetylglucosaminyl deacetylase/CheY-like chemotaxis protein [Microbacterium phyllosphaerae]MCS3442093.1 LmbE family N-acetylglucosaminyl deacetylase/CheY-like chemotaxis protein [Microbacterium phyllosphaerae]